MPVLQLGKVVGVYKIISPSGKFYIGSSFDVMKRWHGHKSDLTKGRHHCNALQKSALKYGVDQLEFKLLLICSREDARFYEQRTIDILNPEYNSTTNTREPLSGLWKDAEFREAGIKRCSAQAKKWRLNPEWIQKQRDAASKHLSFLHTLPEFRKAHAIRATVRLQSIVNSSPVMKKKAVDCRNAKYAGDEELKNRRSIIAREVLSKLREKPEFVEDLREKSRIRMKEMRADPKARARNLEAVIEFHSKAIKCIETGYVFKSCSSAGEWLGVSRENVSGKISRCASGKSKKSFGYRWEYISKEEFRMVFESQVITISAKQFSRLNKVRCIDTGEIFESIKAAAINCGRNNGSANIMSAINGKTNLAYGLRWQRVEG